MAGGLILNGICLNFQLTHPLDVGRRVRGWASHLCIFAQFSEAVTLFSMISLSLISIKINFVVVQTFLYIKQGTEEIERAVCLLFDKQHLLSGGEGRLPVYSHRNPVQVHTAGNTIL